MKRPVEVSTRGTAVSLGALSTPKKDVRDCGRALAKGFRKKSNFKRKTDCAGVNFSISSGRRAIISRGVVFSL